MTISTPTAVGLANGTTTATLASSTPAANATFFAYVSAYHASVTPDPANISISDNSGANNADNGTTAWDIVGGQAYDTGVDRRMAARLFRKRWATSPGSISIQGGIAGAADCNMGIISVVTTNGLAVVTNINWNNNAAGDPSMTITTPAASSCGLAFANGQGNIAYGAVTGYTELNDSNWGGGNSRRGVVAYANGSAPVTYNPTSTNTYTIGVLVELVEAALGGAGKLIRGGELRKGNIIRRGRLAVPARKAFWMPERRLAA